MKPQERLNTILTAPCLDTAAKVVAIAISSHLSDDDSAWCWPGLATIVQMTGLAERTVQDVLAWAAAPEVGWLVVEHRRGGTCRYAFDWNQLSSQELPPRTGGQRKARRPAEPPQGAHPCTGRTPAAGALTPAGGAPTPAAGADRTDHDPTRNRPVGREDARGPTGGATVDPRLAEVVGTRPDLLRLLVRPLDPKDPPIRDLAELRRTPLTAEDGPDLVHRSGMGPQRARQLAALLDEAGVPLVAVRPPEAAGAPARASPAADNRKRGLAALDAALANLNAGDHRRAVP